MPTGSSRCQGQAGMPTVITRCHQRVAAATKQPLTSIKHWMTATVGLPARCCSMVHVSHRSWAKLDRSLPPGAASLPPTQHDPSSGPGAGRRRWGRHRPTRVVLLDFDGPICSVFAGYPSVHAVTATLRALEAAGFEIRPEWMKLKDPHQLLVKVATQIPEAVGIAEDALTRSEVHAVESAQITAGVTVLIDQITDRGQQWAVVSNNSAESIARFCVREDFARTPSLTVGRPKGEPHRMKPNPFVLRHALEILRTPARDAIFIGDSVSDIQAGRAVGIPTIGYANKPAKPKLLEAALADVVITSMDDLLSEDD